MAYDTGQSGTAQCGVIPLRPLAFADVLRGMFRTAVGYWRQLIVLSLAVFLVSYALIHGAVTVAFHSVGDQAQLLLEDGTVGGPLLVVGGVVLLGTMAVTAFAVTLVHSICAVVVRHAVLGGPLTVRETWSRALVRLLAVFAALSAPMLTAFVVLVAVLVLVLYAGPGGLVLLPPAVLFLVWIWARWSLAPAAVVFEGAGPLTALRRSARLVRGSWWRVFAISLLFLVVANVGAYAIGLPFEMAQSATTLVDGADGAGVPADDGLWLTRDFGVGGLLTLLGPAVAATLSTLLPQLASTLLYVDRRLRTESLAPVLAAAAYVPPEPVRDPEPAHTA